MRRPLLFPLGAVFGASLAFAAPAFAVNDLFTDLAAQNGTYLDSSGNGNNWSVGGTPPTYIASCYNGNPCWSFDGATSTPIYGAHGSYGDSNYNFAMPLGDLTLVFVASLDPTTSTGDNKFRALAAAGTLNSTSNEWGFGIKNRLVYWASSLCSDQNTWSGTSVYGGSNTNLTVTQPHLIALAWNAAAGTVSLCVDACAAGWQTHTLVTPASSGPYDVTIQLGTTGASTVCGAAPNPWLGGLFRGRIYRESLATPAKAAEWALIRDGLRTKFGTP